MGGHPTQLGVEQKILGEVAEKYWEGLVLSVLKGMVGDSSSLA